MEIVIITILSLFAIIFAFALRRARKIEKECFDKECEKWRKYNEYWNRGHELLIKTIKEQCLKK
jgi:hypothetical protein